MVIVGRLGNGVIDIKNPYSLCTENEIRSNQNYLHVILLTTLRKLKLIILEAGDIEKVSGIENINIGDTISNDNLNRCHV